MTWMLTVVSHIVKNFETEMEDIESQIHDQSSAPSTNDTAWKFVSAGEAYILHQVLKNVLVKDFPFTGKTPCGRIVSHDVLRAAPEPMYYATLK